MEYTKALNKAAALCSKKEYCCSDIRNKLVAWEVAGKEIGKIIDFLIGHQFLDDLRFSESYANDKFRFNKWGKRKITEMLRRKGIDMAVIQTVLKKIPDHDYDHTCESLLKNKLKSIKHNHPLKKKAALLRFGLNKGFDYETVLKIIHKIMYL